MSHIYKANNARDLARAVKDRRSEIEVTYDLRTAILRIRMVGDVAWVVAFAAIGAAIILWLNAPVVTRTPFEFPAARAAGIFVAGTAVMISLAVTILGIDATTVAITVGVTAGGVGAVSSIRKDYKLVEKSGRYYLQKARS